MREYQDVAKLIRKILKTKVFESNDKLYLKLIESEEIWRDTLISSKAGKQIYLDFIDYVLDDKKNIRDARPFFRVKQEDFKTKINPFIKKRRPDKLFDQKINAYFIQWVLQRYSGPNKEFLEKLAQEIYTIRNDFITRNFPFILNRIKIIWYQVPNAGMADFISAASQAAINALDKFVPTYNKKTGQYEYTSVILSSIIVRINAIANQELQERKVAVKGNDKKKISEISKLRKEGYTDDEIPEKMKISQEELMSLCNLNNVNSLDEMVAQGAVDDLIYKDNPEEVYSSQENVDKISNVFGRLNNLQKKILVLKGFYDG